MGTWGAVGISAALTLDCGAAAPPSAAPSPATPRTQPALPALVTDLGTLGVNDGLVVFFADHGASVPQLVGGTTVDTGYIVPVDAENRDGQVASWRPSGDGAAASARRGRGALGSESRCTPDGSAETPSVSRT
ncbi:MAG: hypothetical protein E6J90_51070 [Deltaproteobacteria bacterium]|nr:MAG: hypothetical protein E6J90_51070 [Deltaproteobacteria bacterium]